MVISKLPARRFSSQPPPTHYVVWPVKKKKGSWHHLAVAKRNRSLSRDDWNWPAALHWAPTRIRLRDRRHPAHFKTMAPPRFTCPLCGVVDALGRRRCDHCRCARCFLALPCAAAGGKRRCDDASRRDDVRSTAPAPLAPHTPLRPPREKRAAAAVCDTLEAPSAGPRRCADDAKSAPETPARPRRRRPKTARRSRRIAAAAAKKAVALEASKASRAVGT